MKLTGIMVAATSDRGLYLSQRPTGYSCYILETSSNGLYALKKPSGPWWVPPFTRDATALGLWVTN